MNIVLSFSSEISQLSLCTATPDHEEEIPTLMNNITKFMIRHITLYAVNFQVIYVIDVAFCMVLMQTPAVVITERQTVRQQREDL
jgi:hypothetical protein